MTEAEERKLAADITRGIAGGVAVIPVAGGPLAAGLNLIATLIEKLGASKAEETLKALVSNPAPLITQADLDAQTRSVIDELT